MQFFVHKPPCVKIGETESEAIKALGINVNDFAE